MNSIVFIIALSAVAFVIGRSIRDLFRKRPIREKKARRKILNRFFGIVALIVIIVLFLVLSVVETVMAFTEGIPIDEAILVLLILAFCGYLSVSLIKYIKNL